MSKLEILYEISEKYNGLIQTKVAAEYGVSRASLSMYCKQNRIKRIEKGVYVLPEKEKDLYFYLTQNADKFIFSHEAAVFLNQMILDEPVRPSITVPFGITPTIILESGCNVYYIKKEMFDFGVTRVKTPYGNEVYTYDMERTVCDMVRSHRRVGEEMIIRTLRAYLSNENKDIKKLFSYAEQFKISMRLYKYWNQVKEEYKQISENEK